MRKYLMLLTVLAIQAQAAELALEQGQCRFSSERDGTFWQSDSGRNNYMTPRCTSFAVSNKFEKGGRLGWRVAYIVTGDIEAHDNMAVMNDHGVRGAPCSPPSNLDGCRALINGSGHMRGFSFSGTGDLKLGPITAIGEFGLLFFKSQFKATATITDFQGATLEVNEESHWTDQPIPLIGLTLRWKDIYVAARHYWPAEHRAISLTNHAFTQVSVGAVMATF